MPNASLSPEQIKLRKQINSLLDRVKKKRAECQMSGKPWTGDTRPSFWSTPDWYTSYGQPAGECPVKLDQDGILLFEKIGGVNIAIGLHRTIRQPDQNYWGWGTGKVYWWIGVDTRENSADIPMYPHFISVRNQLYAKFDIPIPDARAWNDFTIDTQSVIDEVKCHPSAFDHILHQVEMYEDPNCEYGIEALNTQIIQCIQGWLPEWRSDLENAVVNWPNIVTYFRRTYKRGAISPETGEVMP